MTIYRYGLTNIFYDKNGTDLNQIYIKKAIRTCFNFEIVLMERSRSQKLSLGNISS